MTASLLLHAALIVLVTHRLSISSPANRQLPTLTVELLGKSPTLTNAPRLQKPNTTLIAKPTPSPVTAEHETSLTSPAEQAQNESEAPEQTVVNTRATPLEPDSGAASLNIQPLNKLTRLPAFLRKIEPVYPDAEQRAGSQAYVLAEVTIDVQGMVLAVKIIKSAGNAFDNAVTEALKKSKFVPGYIGKDAVAVRVVVPFRFNLR